MDEQERRMARAIEAYDAQGWHRTGTAVDAASGRWLADMAEAAGLIASLEEYELDRLDPVEALLEVEGRQVQGLPLFDAARTEAEGVTGRLASAGSGSTIGLSVLDGAPAVEQFERLRAAGGHDAMVAVTIGRRPGLQARNATHFTSPFGPPVLQVGDESLVWLQKLAERGATARVVVAASISRARSANVVARREGRDPHLEPVIVTTPRSGWWHCAAERGGGIACWLEVARAVAVARPQRAVWFVAFSGHELGHLGSDAFLARRPEMASHAKVWVHFGANVGGATEPGVRLGASTADFLRVARGFLDSEGVTALDTAPVGRVLGLEPQAINAAGGRCITLVGGSAHFHLQSDRWPEAVDVESAARQARALTRLVLELASA